jgi:hypothetical protein
LCAECSADAKTLKLTGRRLRQRFDVLNARTARPLPAPGEHALDHGVVASTRPSGRLRTQPVAPARIASWSV